MPRCWGRPGYVESDVVDIAHRVFGVSPNVDDLSNSFASDRAVILVGSSWKTLAAVLDVFRRGCRCAGWHLKGYTLEYAIEKAMNLEESDVEPAWTVKQIIYMLCLEKTFYQLSYVQRYPCMQCGNRVETWTRRFRIGREKAPITDRWCQTCWDSWNDYYQTKEEVQNEKTNQKNEQMFEEGEQLCENEKQTLETEKHTKEQTLTNSTLLWLNTWP